MNDDVCVIVPVYNEGKVVADTIRTVMKKFSFVVCVDDGSKDDSIVEISKTKARLVRHPINMGQGAALQTGIDYGLQFPHINYFVTFDADGQHDIQDVQRMLDCIRNNQEMDIVLGSRFLGVAKDITRFKRLLLKSAVWFSNLTTGLHLSDAHNGLRVFNRKVADNLEITMPDMAHASEIIHRIAERKFIYKEVPVTILYTEYSRAKGQPMINAINIAFDLFVQRLVKK
jgi:glycosyltransferase involved in cell wall biosynthesis